MYFQGVALVEWATPPSTLAYAFALQHRYRDRDRYLIDQVQEILGAHGIHSPRETLEWQAVVKHVQQHAGRSLDQPLPIHALLRDLIGNLYTLKAHASMVDHTLFSGLPSWLLRPVLPDVQLPEVQLIHGWPAAQIQALQQRTAEALGKLVVFRDVLKAGGEGPEMVMIPAGKFSMGSPINEPKGSRDEAPQHEVTFAKPFALGRYAVTFEEYDHYCQAVGKDQLGDAGWGRGRRPVINVTWHDAQAYCAWLSEQTGQRYRLPSEAEWEYACRAGSMTPFHWGNDITTQQANYNGSHAYIGEAGGLYRQMTLPVGQFQPNAFGLYDCHGNVWEWCEDHWHSCYLQAPVDGSAWVDGDGNCRVVRGGSWYFYPFKLRSAFRYYDFVAISRPYGGFRVARDL
jgi:formylglycine-generating enzyme required for sulfatase activity